ncbi:hypothetical protein BC938DRAFT_482316 [Jimgerdemannia flammicorona]|uniref:GH18 domain-containing protein n=1 Tax=Jimgerdemannia flammicorona TaxID=994334 RepID=A0A433QE94_9FUNG|nr:hypothetical protein BC938DRAFT_482316 [Jimgerdemannia flammicorona]
MQQHLPTRPQLHKWPRSPRWTRQGGPQHRVKVQASVGGWENSQFFSYAVGSLTDRLNVTKIVDFKIVDFNLDVIDIDWSCVPPSTAAGRKAAQEHYHRRVRHHLHRRLRQQHGQCERVRKAYDLNGPWDTNAAPNGPLYNIRSTSVAAGMLKNKIVIGTPWYSHSGLATSVPAGADFYVPIDPQTPKGDRDDIPVADNCPGQTKAFSGQWKFKNYFHQKVLKNPTTANAPWVRHFDPVTSIPLLRPHGCIATTLRYDNPQSLTAKAMFARCGVPRDHDMATRYGNVTASFGLVIASCDSSSPEIAFGCM